MPCIQQLNKDIGEDAAFRFVFEGSEFLNDLTEGLDPVECKYPMILLVFFSFHFRKKTKLSNSSRKSIKKILHFKIFTF